MAAVNARPKMTVLATVDMSSVIFRVLRTKLHAKRDVKIKKSKHAVKVRERSEFMYIPPIFFFLKRQGSPLHFF